MIKAKYFIAMTVSLVSCAIEPGVKDDSEYVRYINEHRGTIEAIIRKTDKYTSSDSAAAMAVAAPASPKGYEQPLRNLRVLYIGGGQGGRRVDSEQTDEGLSAQDENEVRLVERKESIETPPTNKTAAWQCTVPSAGIGGNDAVDKKEKSQTSEDVKKTDKRSLWPSER